RETALPHHQMARELDAAEIAVVRIDPVERRVAGKADVHLRLDALDQVVFADRAAHRVLVEGGERDDLLTLDGGELRRRPVGGRALEKAVRRQPEIERSSLRASIQIGVLDDVAGDWPDATLEGRRVVPTSAAALRRIHVVDP